MAGHISQNLIDAQAEFVSKLSDWALVTAGTQDGGWNTMTIEWGTAGVIWGRPTLTVFVHPLRYTHQFLVDNDYFTVQLFDKAFGGAEHPRKSRTTILEITEQKSSKTPNRYPRKSRNTI